MAVGDHSFVNNFLGLLATIWNEFLWLVWLILVHKFFEHVHAQSSLYNKVKFHTAIFIQYHIFNSVDYFDDVKKYSAIFILESFATMNKTVKELFENLPRMKRNFYLTVFKDKILEKFICICYYAEQGRVISVVITKSIKFYISRSSVSEISFRK